MTYNKEQVKEIFRILMEFVEKEGNKTLKEFIDGWNKHINPKVKIERI